MKSFLLLSGLILLTQISPFAQYVAVSDAEVMSEQDSYSDVRSRRELDEKVEIVDKDARDAFFKKSRQMRAASTKYIKVRLADGTEGWMLESMLSDEISAFSAQAGSVRASSGSQSAGAAASGTVSPFMEFPDISLEAKGTGRTTGHVADLTVTNSTSKTETVSIPISEIPSDGTHQGFVLSEPIETTVPPNSTITIAVNGFCTSANLPAPERGTIFVSPKAWPTSTPLTDAVPEILRVLRFQRLKVPPIDILYPSISHGIDKVAQEVIWIHNSTPESPYTVDDICTRAMTSLTTALGRPVSALAPAEKSSIDYKLLQLIDVVTKVGEGAGLPAFQTTPAPPAASRVIDAPPSTHPNIANAITVTSTGRTTGHIADLNVSNPTDKPVNIQIGNGSMYIPAPNSSDRTRDANQGFVTQGIPVFTLGPGETATVPVYGYCADIHVPPLDAGGRLPDVPSWISSGPYQTPTAPSILPSSPGSPVPEFVFIPTCTALSLAETVDLLDDLPIRPAGPSLTPCPEGTFTNTPFIPGTNRPIPIPLSPEQQPGAAVPLLIDALSKIATTYDEMRNDGAINTPFSSNPEKERESVIQQTFWGYAAGLRGEPYQKEDFKAKTYQQFEQASGKPVEKLPEPEQEKLEVGVDDFWNTFEAVGVEAKVMSVPPAKPMSAPPVDEFWNGYDAGETKPKGTTSETPGGTPSVPGHSTVPPTVPPELIADDNCDCGDVSLKATLVIGSEKSEVHDFTTKLVDAGKIKTTKTIIDAAASAPAGAEIKIDITDLVVTCGKCKNKDCKKSEPTVTIKYGELESDNGSKAVTEATITKDGSNYSLAAKMPEGDKDVGFFITVAYTCSDNACGEVPCEEKFLLRVKRKGVCACKETFLTPTVKHDPADKTKDEKEEPFTFLEDEVVWRHTVAKDDVINVEIEKPDPKIRIDNLKADCEGCKNTCVAGNFRYKVFGTNITGLTSEADAKEVKYSSDKTMKLLTNKKISGDGDASISIKVLHTCASKGCDSAECEKTFTILFKGS